MLSPWHWIELLVNIRLVISVHHTPAPAAGGTIVI